MSDAVPLIRESSGVVLVAKADATSRDGLTKARQMIDAAKGTLLGSVLTGVDETLLANLLVKLSNSGTGYQTTTFTASNGQEREDTVRDLSRLEIVRRGRHLRITAEADGFLYKMVRSLAGALVAAGEGKLTPAQIQEILASRTRTNVVLTAPPQGLFLEKVFYR